MSENTKIQNITDFDKLSTNTIIKKSDIKLDLSLLRSKRGTKWEGLTKNHSFEPGDVYVIPLIEKELTSFRAYVRKKFRLSVNAYRSENGEKYICELTKMITRNK